MNRGDGPMPLEDLSGYIDSVRRDGQGDFVPVVEMGRISDSAAPSRARWMVPLSLAACVLVAAGLLLAVSTEDVTVVGSPQGALLASKEVSREGGRVLSVSRDESGAYRFRVFRLGGVGSLAERLRGVEGVDSVEVGE